MLFALVFVFMLGAGTGWVIRTVQYAVGIQTPASLRIERRIKNERTGTTMIVEEVRIKTRPEGHIINVFYNHDSKLLVIDVVHKGEKGGNEIMRKTLDFTKLLGHAKRGGRS